jgi:catechol 2,3-dioxygenase-like lactoylglutathione lyase family enzyme
MQNLGLAHYNIRASSDLLETLRDFYVEAIGLTVGPRAPLKSVGYWLYAGGRDVLHLSTQGPSEHRRTGSDLTFDHVAFDCRGAAGWEQRLQALGIPFRRVVIPESGHVQYFLRDPAGNGVELNFPPE